MVRAIIRAFINDDDAQFQSLVRELGYEKEPERDRPTARFTIPTIYPQ
jgi:hypothetical protein